MMRRSSFVVAGLGVALVIGVLLSNLASTRPDGLESAVLSSACDRYEECLAERAGGPVFDDAPLPDYANTPLSGLLGTVAAFAVGAGLIVLVRSGRGTRGRADVDGGRSPSG